MFSYRALRSLVTKRRPPQGRYQYGELYVNLADDQIGVIDENQIPQDLLAITFWKNTARYVEGDHVIYQNRIYIANKDIDPGHNFDFDEWDTSGVDLSVADYDQSIPYSDGDTAYFPNFGCFLTANQNIPANEAYNKDKWELPCKDRLPDLPDIPDVSGHNIGDVFMLPYAPSIQELSHRQWIICEGQLLNTTGAYANLFGIYGFKFGQNSSQTQFRLPDFRGYVPRGVDASRAVDPDSNTRTGSGTNRGAMGGTFQGDQFRSHTHSVTLGEPENDYINAPGARTGFSKHKVHVWYGYHTANATGGNETRMKNIGVHFFAQY